MNEPRSAAACILLVALMGCGREHTAGVAAGSQPVVRDERLALTAPPQCRYVFEVFKGEVPGEYGRVLLAAEGTGVAGLPEGSGLKVSCDDTTGTGWIDSAGELRAFIAPPKGWFVEHVGGEWRPAPGELHVITKRLPLEAQVVEASYALYTGGAPGPYAQRLLSLIGIGIAGAPGSAKVTLADGREMRGTLSASGVLSITAQPWQNDAVRALGP